MPSLIFVLLFKRFFILSPKYFIPNYSHIITIINKPAPITDGQIIYELILKQHTAIAENMKISFKKYFLSSFKRAPRNVHLSKNDFKNTKGSEMFN
jgi:hypothetical protein